MPQAYVKKNGQISNYDINKYNATSYAKNREKILNDKLYCDYCDVSYLKSNHSNHIKSKRHLTVVTYANKITHKISDVRHDDSKGIDE